MEKLDIPEEKKTIEKFDILGNLPLELAHEVLIRLTPEGLANSLKCKQWQHLTNNEYFWRSLNQKFEYDLDEEPNSEDYRKNFRSYSLQWKRRFMYNRYQECIVENEAFRKIRVKLKRFRSYDFIHFDDSTLILAFVGVSQVGYWDGDNISLLIIDSPTGLVKYKFDFNFLAAIKHGNLLIAISYNFHLKIWNIENGECIIDVKMDDYHNDHDMSCKLLACKHLILITAARTWPILISLYTFNMKTKQFAYLVDEWTDVCCTNDRIAILKYTGSIEILDSNLNSQMKFNCSKTSKIYQALMNDDFLTKWYMSGTEGRTLSIWNIKTKTNFKIPLEDFGNMKEIVLTSKKTLICLITSLRLEMWDMSKQNRLFEISLKKGIFDPILNERYIFTPSLSLGKHLIQIWCLRTGRFVKGYLWEHNGQSSLKAATNSKLLYKFLKDTQRLSDLWRIYDYNYYMSEVELQ